MNKKLFNVLLGFAFGFGSYIICVVATTVVQSNTSQNIFLFENISYFVSVLYGFASAYLFKSTMSERIIRVVIKPVAVLAAFDATFKLRNAVYDIIGFVSPSGPGDAMTLLLFYVFVALGTVLGLIAAGIATAVKRQGEC